MNMYPKIKQILMTTDKPFLWICSIFISKATFFSFSTILLQHSLFSESLEIILFALKQEGSIVQVP